MPRMLERLMIRCLEDAAVTSDDDVAMARRRTRSTTDDDDDSDGVNLILMCMMWLFEAIWDSAGVAGCRQEHLNLEAENEYYRYYLPMIDDAMAVAVACSTIACYIQLAVRMQPDAAAQRQRKRKQFHMVTRVFQVEGTCG